MQGWKDEYSVGIAIMDDQHRELIKLLVELSDALDRREKLDVAFTLTRLDVYSLYHFASEEQLLARYAFYGLEDHKRDHDEFKKRIGALKSKHADSPDKEFEVAAEILGTVLDWVEDHLMLKDKEYARFIAEQEKQ